MKVKLSEMYTVYWEYVEKTSGFVQGKEAIRHLKKVPKQMPLHRMWKKYGIVPGILYRTYSMAESIPNHEDNVQ